MTEHSEPLTGWMAPTTGQAKWCTAYYLLTCLVFLLGFSQNIPAQSIPPSPALRSRETGQPQQETGRTLGTTASIAAEITGDQAHSYRLTLTSGQFVHIIVSQQRIRLAIALNAPDGVKLRELNSPDDTDWPEHLWLIAETSGTYVLEVRNSDKTTPEDVTK